MRGYALATAHIFRDGGEAPFADAGDASSTPGGSYMGIEYLTADELALRLRLSADTVRKWARAGIIPSIRLSPKVIRFDTDAVGNALRAEKAVARGK